MSSEQNFKEILVKRVREDRILTDVPDAVAAEEPLEIRIGFTESGKSTHKSISITMRTPGDDFDLAAGFLFTEGIIKSPDEIRRIRHCGFSAKNQAFQNTVRVDLHDELNVDLKKLERHFYTSSSCGVCGKTSIDALKTGANKLKKRPKLIFSTEIIHRLPKILISAQKVFACTGGLHAAALFNAAGEIEGVREDVGRHNAVDKLLGAEFLAGETPLSEKLLFVSGRASFELVQKALMAGIPIMAAVGAPSSLSVELASEYGMTLLGFVRADRFNIYAGAERIKGKPTEAFGKSNPENQKSRRTQ